MIRLDTNLCSSSSLGRLPKLPGDKLRADKKPSEKQHNVKTSVGGGGDKLQTQRGSTHFQTSGSVSVQESTTEDSSTLTDVPDVLRLWTGLVPTQTL